MCVSVQIFVEIGGTIANYIAIYLFSEDGGRPPFWIRGANIGTSLKENLVVFISVQNLVAIALVISIMQKFEYFALLA